MYEDEDEEWKAFFRYEIRVYVYIVFGMFFFKYYFIVYRNILKRYFGYLELMIIIVCIEYFYIYVILVVKFFKVIL